MFSSYNHFRAVVHVHADILTLGPWSPGAVVNIGQRHWIALRWDPLRHVVWKIDSLATPTPMQSAEYVRATSENDTSSQLLSLREFRRPMFKETWRFGHARIE